MTNPQSEVEIPQRRAAIRAAELVVEEAHAAKKAAHAVYLAAKGRHELARAALTETQTELREAVKRQRARLAGSPRTTP